MALDTRTCFWFERDAMKAAVFYASLFPDSAIEDREGHDMQLHDGRTQADAGVTVINLRLLGTPYQFLEAGPMFPQTSAASISVLTEDQAETDRLWSALSEGGSEQPCGWLRDRFGLHWQIVPEALVRLMQSPGAGQRVMAAMMEMTRIDIAALEAAAGQGA
jgi:predicted 3-demethylubiquinone-9 3-methyltransferase (glyoxalase superfamily)